jgi:hypothetical protein
MALSPLIGATRQGDESSCVRARAWRCQERLLPRCRSRSQAWSIPPASHTMRCSSPMPGTCRMGTWALLPRHPSVARGRGVPGRCAGHRLPHQIAAAPLPEAQAIWHTTTGRDAPGDRRDPSPASVQGLGGQFFLQGTCLATGLLPRHEDLVGSKYSNVACSKEARPGLTSCASRVRDSRWIFVVKVQPVFRTLTRQATLHKSRRPSSHPIRSGKRSIIRTRGRSKDWAGNASGQAGSHIVITRGRRLWR